VAELEAAVECVFASSFARDSVQLSRNFGVMARLSSAFTAALRGCAADFGAFVVFGAFGAFGSAAFGCAALADFAA